MAFSRKFLKELLAEHPNRDEVIDQLIELHIQAVSPLKTELNQLQEENGGKTADEVHAEVEHITAEIAKLKESGSADGEDWKTRYEAVKAEFEASKAEGDKKAAYKEKEDAFRNLLLAAGARGSLADRLTLASRDIIEGMEIDCGKIKNHTQIADRIEAEYGDIIESSKSNGVKVYLSGRQLGVN